jgi:pantetheine-phosphate adenylyltransferase
MEKTAIFPGSFDPFTVGHESIVSRALPLFDKIIIAIGHNINKEYYFPLEKRVAWIKSIFRDNTKIDIKTYKGLTVDFCRQVNARYILRGLRTSSDFEYERAVGQMNKAMYPEIETVFLLTMPQHTAINSTIVRDIIRYGGDASLFLPKDLKINE